MIAALIATINAIFRCPITTTHAEARKSIKHHQAMLLTIQNRINASDAPSHLQVLKEYRLGQIAKQQTILKNPSHLLFPTFLRFAIGENEIGLSLAGLRCNIPSLARKYGEEMPYAGNHLGYRNWLGYHTDL